MLDGDTLRLTDGRDVRLIGIDTPELAHGRGHDRPFSREATAALKQLILDSGWRIRLRPGAENRDRHGRMLAHGYTVDGSNLSASLLRQGLGYQAVVAPNLGHLACYQAAERQARSAALGLWRKGVDKASQLVDAEAGFHLLQGRVERVGESRRSIWLNLDGGVAIRVPRALWRDMAAEAPESYEGRRLEVRGWFYRQQGGLRLTLSHPAALRWL